MKFNPKQLPSGSWRVRVFDYKDSEGKKHYKSFTSPNKRVCVEMAKKYTEDKKVQQSRPHGQYEELTLEEACLLYIDMKSGVLSPTTIRSYEAYTRSALDELKKMVIKYITSVKMQQYVSRLSQINSPKTVKNKAIFIKSVLDYFIPFNQIRIDYPMREKPEISVPILETFWKIYDAAPDDIKIPILLGGMCGMRRGEIAGLRPEDVTDMGISIRRSLVKDENNQWVIKSPKSTSGYRFVPLGYEHIELVRAWTFDIKPDRITKAFKKTCRDLGYEDLHFHCIRHMFATELYDKGFNPLTICSYTGHKNPNTVTGIYAHAKRDLATDNKVIDIMSGKEPAQKERSS